MSEKQDLALEPTNDEGSDFRLREDRTSCWVEVNNISLHIVRLDSHRVSVEAYRKNDEMEDAIAEIEVT
jgi:hypothetical protein